MNGWFWGLDRHHVLYFPLYTTASLSIMLGPEAQALLYLMPTEYLFRLPYLQTQSSEISFSFYFPGFIMLLIGPRVYHQTAVNIIDSMQYPQINK